MKYRIVLYPYHKLFNNCVVYWQFFANLVWPPYQKTSPRIPPKISIRIFSFNKNFRKCNSHPKFDRKWAGNDHFWSYGWSFRNLEKSTKLSVSWNGVPVPSSRYLGKKLPIGDATIPLGILIDLRLYSKNSEKLGVWENFVVKLKKVMNFSQLYFTMSFLVENIPTWAQTKRLGLITVMNRHESWCR